MNILICPSHNYIMPYGIMLESLFTNNGGEDIRIHAIIDEDVTVEDKNAIDDIVRKHNAAINYVFFPESGGPLLPDMSRDRLTRAAFFRLFSASLLPEELTKILYLDGDIIVMDNLRGLWETDIDDVAVAGIMDQWENNTWYNRLHYSGKLGYINSGVLLINLRYWREHQVESRFMSFEEIHPERIKQHDQDIINYVLREEKLILPLRYNVQNAHYYKPEYSMLDYWNMESEILDAQKNPVILHFAGAIKPWNLECKHPRVKDFEYYKKKTIWADKPLTSVQTKKQRIISLGKMVLEWLHILPQRECDSKYVEDSFH